MGVEAWSCFVPYEPDIASALEAARKQEFQAGRYRMRDVRRPPSTIEQARAEFPGSSTASVLDVTGVSTQALESGSPVSSSTEVAPISEALLLNLFGTNRPARAQLENSKPFRSWLDRGYKVYIILYEGETPTEIYFAGNAPT